MRCVLALVALACLFAFSEASALKSRPQDLQWSCDVEAIETLYDDIWNGTFAFRSTVYDNVIATKEGVWNCLSYMYNVEKVWSCAMEVVEEEVNQTLEDLQDYLSDTKDLCDELTEEIKNCFTL